jgi:hypothetical protein
MKQQHSIRVDDEVWAALTEMAAARGYAYRGRPNPGRVVEDLVRGAPGPVEPAAAQPAPTQPAPAAASVPAYAQPSYGLADIVARWPEKTQAQWQQEEWKAGRWVKLVLDTINGAA